VVCPFRFSDENILDISHLSLSLSLVHIVFDKVTLTAFSEQYALRSSSLCSFLPSPGASPVLGPYFFPLCTLFSDTPSLFFPGDEEI